MPSEAGDPPGAPYGSAHDLPSFVELRQQMRALKTITRFVMRDKRQELIDLEEQMTRLADTVDAFYERLGARHWVFNDWLSMDGVELLLRETATPEKAEERLIELYQDPKTAKIRMVQLRAIPGLQERHHQILRAREDYEAGRYDSCTLILIAVMDGFVNDFQSDRRRGLTAREADEMVAWDSVAGHHMGLTNALKPFLKTIKKRVDEEVFELHRHGIVHGSVVQFNNVVVASKAWNLLFAVVDWSLQETKRQVEPEPTPSLRETLSRVADHGRWTRERKEFSPWAVSCTDDAFTEDAVARATADFIEAWTKGQWGRLVPVMPPQLMRQDQSAGEAAVTVKSWFEFNPIADARLEEIRYTQAGVAEAWGAATIRDKSGQLRIRWVYYDSEGRVASTSGPGKWHLAVVAPHTYLVDER